MESVFGQASPAHSKQFSSPSNRLERQFTLHQFSTWLNQFNRLSQSILWSSMTCLLWTWSWRIWISQFKGLVPMFKKLSISIRHHRKNNRSSTWQGKMPLSFSRYFEMTLSLLSALHFQGSSTPWWQKNLQFNYKLMWTSKTTRTEIWLPSSTSTPLNI